MKTVPFKPMLSATAEDSDLDALDYERGIGLEPKLDGIRCIILNGVAVSRNLKPIRSEYIQTLLSSLPDGLDGELICGAPTGIDDQGRDVWNRSNSGVMSASGEPDFTYWVFDMVNTDAPAEPFANRRRAATRWCGHPYVKLVPHHVVRDRDGLDYLEQFYVAEGYEGVMIKGLRSGYKYGRATVKEGGLLKLKRWHDAEATITGFVERMENQNAATTDALGRTKRSTAQAGKVGRGDLGALQCSMIIGDKVVPFDLGTGFSDKQRADIWADRNSYAGRQVTFKYQMLGETGAPRFPVFKGFRDSTDLPATNTKKEPL